MEKMKLSEQLKIDHESGDFGRALDGYSERAEILEDAIIAMVNDGFLCGSGDMSDAQKACYKAYQEIINK